MTNTASGGVSGSLRCVDDGTGALQIEARLEAAIRDAWSALTDPRRLATWYGVVEGDLAQGGAYSARLFASGWEGTGRVEACERPRRLVVVSRGRNEQKERSTAVTLTTEAGETVVVVEQQGVPLELLWAYATGMQIHVEDLRDHLAGRERRDAAPRFDEFSPVYRTMAAELG